MRELRWVAAAVAVALVAGCSASGHYPISQSKAGPNDPVLSMAVPVRPGH